MLDSGTRSHKQTRRGLILTALELYNKGMPVKSIARQIGFSEGHTRKILKAQGYVPSRVNGTRVVLEQAIQALDMRNSGKSWQSISDKIGPSYKALKRAVNYYAAQGLIESVLP